MGSIPFDYATAVALVRALESTDQRIYDQSLERADGVDTAMAEFEGGYARLFSGNATHERLDRSDLCFHLLNVASQVQSAQAAAEVEEERLAAVAEWERNYAAWEADATREGSFFTAVVDSEYRALMWSQPSQTPARRPNVQSDVSVRDRHRVSTGGGGSVSSASVNDLRSFVSTANSCNRIVAEELDALKAAWINFRGACSWVIVETFTLLQALEQYLEHGELDAQWIGHNADAFEVAGTGHLPNKVLDALAPALDMPAMTDQEPLDKLATTDAAGLTQLMQNSPALANQLQLIAPGVIHEWWNDVRAEHAHSPQYVLWSTMPEVIGNLEGIPYTIRNRANRLMLRREIVGLEAQLEDLATEREEALNNAGHAPHARQGIYLSFNSRQSDLEEQLTAYEQVAASTEHTFGETPRQLVTLTAGEPPLAAVSIGNLHTASNVTYSVAGMNSNTQTMTDWTEATRSEDDPQLNVLAHSYGTTTAAFAMSQHDVSIDNLIFAGSAGLPNHVTNADDLNADAVYAGHARDVYPFVESGQGDQWAWMGRDLRVEHNVNPMSDDFDALTFGTDSEAPGQVTRSQRTAYAMVRAPGITMRSPKPYAISSIFCATNPKK